MGDPSSRSAFVAFARVVLRLQTAGDENLSNGAFILTAPGRASATSTVRLTRPSGAEVVVGINIRFLDDRGAVWVPSAAFTIPASGGAQTVDVPITTQRAGYYLNSFEPLTYQALDTLPDPTLVIELGVDPAINGTTPFLDQHGKERRVFRSPGETDAQYRNRIRFIEDQVSPKAVADSLLAVLDAFPATKPIADQVTQDGLRFLFEPFKDPAQQAQQGLYGLSPMFYNDSDGDEGSYFDDPGGPVMLTRADACASLTLFLPTPIDPDEARRFFDDSDADAGSWFDDAEFGYFDLTAGPGLTGPIAALADELDRRRAACVGAQIIFGEDVRLVRSPPVGTLTQAGDWEDQDAATTDLLLTAAVGSMDGDDTYAESALGTGAGAALDAGDLLFTLATVAVPVSITRVVLRARVRQVDVGAGVDPSFSFIIEPTTAGAPVRILTPTVVSGATYTEIVEVLEENPVSAAAWTLADIAGTFGLGCANSAAVGATEELRVSELTLEIQANYG